MNRITKQKFSAGATLFLDELFSDKHCNAWKHKKPQRKAKESPRVYSFNPYLA